MRRWIPPTAGLVAFLLVFGVVLASPASAAAVVQDLVHAVPGTGPEGPLEAVAQALDATIEDAARALAFGNAQRLAAMKLRLLDSEPPVGGWHGSTQIELAWADLEADGLRYEVYVGTHGSAFATATLSGNVHTAVAAVEVPGDGDYTVWVRPVADKPGRVSEFGPFRVDASPPPTPVLTAPATPMGYRFSISWTTVADRSGVAAYELHRRLAGGTWSEVAAPTIPGYSEDQIGNGEYEYRVRAVNGAGVPSAWSAPAPVSVRAPMKNPGDGVQTYGIHANYTGFLRLWDLSDPSKYDTIQSVPAAVKSANLGAEPGIEVDNTTLRAAVQAVVGTETNTLRIAEALFQYLFDRVDYDDAAANDPKHEFQRAGLTLDRGKGICGDLAVLYITLLRIAGVPARPVHGYLDNALSGIGGFHMWVEVWVGPGSDARPWMTVDVSGVTGTFQPEDLFPYFGVFNPDYLALGTERNFDRYSDGAWNTWARFRYSFTGNRPNVDDRASVIDYESTHGRLFFDVATKRTHFEPCANANPSKPEDPCPNEPAPPGFSRYYGMKGVSKKRIDYGARLESPLPSCLKVELRYPLADAVGAVVPDQSVIYRVYETTSSTAVRVGAPDADGWVTFLDGTDVPRACENL